MMKHQALALLAALSLSLNTASSNLPLPPPAATASITAADLRKHLNFLASDELGGRFTFSPSLLKAAEYLAAELKSYGYRGAMRDGSFLQKVPLGNVKVNEEKSGITLDIGGVKKGFKFGDDFLAETPFNANFRGEMVFVGYGIHSPENKHDDYAGVSVKGKVVVMVAGNPASLNNAKIPYSTGERAAEAMRRGAVGALVVSRQHLDEWARAKFYYGRGQTGFPPGYGAKGKSLPEVIAGPALVKEIAAAMGKEVAYLTAGDGKALAPAPVKATAEVAMSVDFTESPPTHNVVAVLDGSDPKLKNEYVVFSAHYDHLKTNAAGEVYNGADDDGSGTSAVLEIAQAFTVGQRPKRSVLIVFHTGEELGLFGSEFNTDYEPVVPLKNLVANLNIDMIGRSREPGNTDPRDRELTDKDSIYIIGADKLSSELHRLSEQTNNDTARMRFDYTYNDENHPQRFYYRSDHYNYAKHGVPIIFYFTGVHRDYHRTTDDIEKLDFEKMERITRLVFATGWRVLNLDHRLIVDKKPTPPSSFQ
ncbi:MAG TPA: M28 family peptidase [Blastocatellia bacterium]|nr:M28 family peptidase [Blastocatellia bacterium]